MHFALKSSWRVLALAVGACVPLASFCIELPAGWRLPTSEELQDEARNGSADRYSLVEADFNGDGLTDAAYLLKSQRFSGEGLWVALSMPRGRPLWILLDRTEWPERYGSVPLAMAIELQPRGVVPYACFDEAKDCNFGPVESRPTIKLQTSGIAYFKLESASSLYFWSRRHKRFLRVWLSD